MRRRQMHSHFSGLRTKDVMVKFDEYAVFFVETYGMDKWNSFHENFQMHVSRGLPQGVTFMKLLMSDRTE